MITLDHIAVWSDNLYRTTVELSQSTGIGSTDGGYFPGLGLGQKILSLGEHVYIEVESIIEHRMIADRSPMALELERQTAKGDCFAGLCLRSDSLDEIEAFAQHRGITPRQGIDGGKVPMEAARATSGTVHAPDFWNSWRLGKPNIYYVPDLSGHASATLPQEGTGDVRATGVISIEIGGRKADLQRWLGDVADPEKLGTKIIYNGGPDGLYAVTFGSTVGTQSIRLNPITL
ncbi:VOC family protein [Rhodococcus sp. KBW08]|uniref:VOC family protein n=1 Tax=Rhodococcus sp. KBW08 TaxID=2144188 RepID=UPI00162A16EC|nr:VOC family protein [Rhodococcus sp. KBW08]